jgi:hypothetical protein
MKCPINVSHRKKKNKIKYPHTRIRAKKQEFCLRQIFGYALLSLEKKRSLTLNFTMK